MTLLNMHLPTKKVTFKKKKSCSIFFTEKVIGITGLKFLIKKKKQFYFFLRVKNFNKEKKAILFFFACEKF